MNNQAVRFHDFSPAQSDFLTEVIEGLSSRPKKISPKYFYDQRGSELFDEICLQPEYYPTRTEISILKNNAHDIAQHIGNSFTLVELGSGASEKVRLLFEKLKPESYLGVDISKDFLLQATRQLAKDYPWLDVHAVCSDFSSNLELPEHCERDQLVAFFPGSSIGNFEPEEAVKLLKQVARAVGKNGKLLIGVDLKKQERVLNAAYNDEAGVTADFNLNLLQRMKSELDAHVEPENFSHHAFYNEEKGRVEMHLVSEIDQTIVIGEHEFVIDQNESIHTENSHKYSIDEFAELADNAGFDVVNTWLDEQGLFSVQLLTVKL